MRVGCPFACTCVSPDARTARKHAGKLENPAHTLSTSYQMPIFHAFLSDCEYIRRCLLNRTRCIYYSHFHGDVFPLGCMDNLDHTNRCHKTRSAFHHQCVHGFWSGCADNLDHTKSCYSTCILLPYHPPLVCVLLKRSRSILGDRQTSIPHRWKWL